MSEAIMVIGALLAAALVKAQREVEAALKTSVNEYHRYKYASAEEVISVARDALAHAGISVSPVSELVVAMPGGESAGVSYMLAARYLVQHESGEGREIETHTPIVPEKGRPLDKALFGARTESLGYLLRGLLLIPREDAPDVSGRHDKGGGPDAPRGQSPRPGAAPAATKPAPSKASAPAPTAAKPAAPPTTQAIDIPFQPPANDDDSAYQALAAEHARVIGEATEWAAVDARLAQSNTLPPPHREAVYVAAVLWRIRQASTAAELGKVSAFVKTLIDAGKLTARTANASIAPVERSKKAFFANAPRAESAS